MFCDPYRMHKCIAWYTAEFLMLGTVWYMYSSLDFEGLKPSGYSVYQVY